MIGQEKYTKRSDPFIKNILKREPSSKGQQKNNSNVHQCEGEPAGKLSQLKKTTLEIRDIVNRNFESLQLLEKMLTNFEDTVLKEPEEPKDDDTKNQIFKWELKFKKTYHDKSLTEEGKFALWFLAWGQISDLMITKIKSDT